uniref:Uncharacterized protein n=1 Tax=Mus spicilegus TaxID=10103 RepID=A0A8C6I0F6_MUSSI
MALKKLLAIPKDGYLLLLDCDDEEDDINFLEEAHSEENVSFSVEWQRLASSVETPIDNRNLLSGGQQDGNASKLDLMEGTRYLMLCIDVALPIFSVILIRLVKEIENL